jgi:hypothetical protein
VEGSGCCIILGIFMKELRKTTKMLSEGRLVSRVKVEPRNLRIPVRNVTALRQLDSWKEGKKEINKERKKERRKKTRKKER